MIAVAFVVIGLSLTSEVKFAFSAIEPLEAGLYRYRADPDVPPPFQETSALPAEDGLAPV